MFKSILITVTLFLSSISFSQTSNKLENSNNWKSRAKIIQSGELLEIGQVKKFRFSVNGQTYTLPQEKVASFLRKYPDATFVAEIKEEAKRNRFGDAIVDEPKKVTVIWNDGNKQEFIPLVQKWKL